MSQNLYWRPNVPPKGHDLPDALKFKLRDKFDLYNGPRTFTQGDILYLEGLADCDVKGAKDLIKAIEKHGEVEVYLR